MRWQFAAIAVTVHAGDHGDPGHQAGINNVLRVLALPTVASSVQ